MSTANSPRTLDELAILGADIFDRQVQPTLRPEDDGKFVAIDVVSGDFHWYHRISDDQCLVAAADCTGHGFPGAMMAAIGCSLLNELVVQHPNNDPAELLAMLRSKDQVEPRSP